MENQITKTLIFGSIVFIFTLYSFYIIKKNYESNYSNFQNSNILYIQKNPRLFSILLTFMLSLLGILLYNILKYFFFRPLY